MKFGSLLGIVFLSLVLLLAAKLAWDDFQQERASKQVPEITRIIDSIKLPPEAYLVDEPTISVNEYAASVWRYYKTSSNAAELKRTIEEQIENLGFEFSGESQSYSGPLWTYKSGEYEIRLLGLANSADEFQFALSANWTGKAW